VDGPTLGATIDTATAVEKFRIKQFRAISLAVNLVAGSFTMTMPSFLFLCEAVANAQEPANAYIFIY